MAVLWARYSGARRGKDRHLPPDLKRSIKHALRSLSSDPYAGTPLLGKLSGLWKYKVRRFRIVYNLDKRARIIKIFAIGHRRAVYEEVANRLRDSRDRK